MDPNAKPIHTMDEHQPVKGPRINKGLVILNTGEGPGKTTAALGVILRAWGRGMRVRMFEFAGSADLRRGEHEAADRTGIPIHALNVDARSGAGSWDGQAHVKVQWADACQALLAGEDDVIVLDDLIVAIEAGVVPAADVIEALSGRPAMRHVIITGRHAPDELIAVADLVTEMRVIKHRHAGPGATAPVGIARDEGPLPR